MILSSNGQNIYPEEIEDRLNNMLYVAESLIISQGGKLVALDVYKRQYKYTQFETWQTTRKLFSRW